MGLGWGIVCLCLSVRSLSNIAGLSGASPHVNEKDKAEDGVQADGETLVTRITDEDGHKGDQSVGQ